MINWLSSYPKSGNTWVRLLLSAYLNDSEPDINEISGIYSDQHKQAHRVGFNIDRMDVEEAHAPYLRPMALIRIAYSYKHSEIPDILGEKMPLVLKTHTANANVNGMRMIPPDISDKVVYIVRDPRDVVLSFAKHFGLNIDDSIHAMTTSEVSLFDEEDKDRPPSYSMSWHDNVYTYAAANDLDVTIIKYEDMKEDPVKIFTHILKWYGIPVNKKRVKKAVKYCELSKLRKQEKEKGFQEVSKKSKRFFGNGKTGGWKGILTEEQQDKILEHCEPMMVEFGYL